VISTVAGPAIVGVLAFALAMMAAISLLLLRTRTRVSTLSVEPSRLRTFKRESRSTVIRIGSLGSGFAKVVTISLVAPFGLEGQVRNFERGSGELVLKPMYAGLFEGMRVAMEVTDVLGLFTQTQEVELELVVEALPRALLLPDSPQLVSPMVQGEVPTGGRGTGIELFSIEQYSAGSDAKDIMWKKMARSSDQSIHVRVREANARPSVAMFSVVSSLIPEERVELVDLTAEAMAQLGKRLLSMGVTVELARSDPGGLTVASAADVAELAAAIVRIWSGTAGSSDVHGAMARATLLILGPSQLEDVYIRNAAEGKPSLLIRTGPGQQSPGQGMFVFTGREDLTQLVEVLLDS
jgi:hypothetical protein